MHMFDLFVQMHNVLKPLRVISPSFQHIKLDKKKAEAFPELLEVLKCHTRSMEFMIQFKKNPTIGDFGCKVCKENLFKPVRMPRSV